ncbi:MAG TPA: hypothetical protein VKU01_34980 [Bryobacteraceae bacterium]|nr:hypothetical protein [Bryobacteraceae bacterium]
MEDLVKMGALPRVRLDQAKRDLADAQDDVILQQTLYGKMALNELTEQTTDEMVAAAERRLDRQKEKLEDAKKLVEDGITARNSLDAVQEELNMRELTLNLAHSRAQLIAELTAQAKLERAEFIDNPAATGADSFAGGMEHYEGTASFVESKDLRPIEVAFEKKFEKPLPISALGETEVHKALGFDHRGRVDVALNPTQPEGHWLLTYLRSKKIPFYAFTHAIPGKATGAHIHIGPGSTRLQNAD